MYLHKACALCGEPSAATVTPATRLSHHPHLGPQVLFSSLCVRSWSPHHLSYQHSYHRVLRSVKSTRHIPPPGAIYHHLSYHQFIPSVHTVIPSVLRRRRRLAASCGVWHAVVAAYLLFLKRKYGCILPHCKLASAHASQTSGAPGREESGIESALASIIQPPFDGRENKLTVGGVSYRLFFLYSICEDVAG